jgi:hypothetical protein
MWSKLLDACRWKTGNRESLGGDENRDISSVKYPRAYSDGFVSLHIIM